MDAHIIHMFVLFIEMQDYIQGFTGVAKIRRLLFIAEQCEGESIALDALKMAHDELKSNVCNVVSSVSFSRSYVPGLTAVVSYQVFENI